MGTPAGIAATSSASGADAALARQRGGADHAAGGRPFAAMRADRWVVTALICAAGVAWWSSADRMAGMDAGPGSALGSLAWFTGLWATMMAAMMLPSLAPAAAVFSASVRREVTRLVAYAGGYLLVWSVAGLAAYGVFELGRQLLGGSLAWHGAGRFLAAGVLALAAVYQLTPWKRACLSRCRGPLAGPAISSQDTRGRALQTGMHSGVWCLGSSWASMAALFALGAMSLVWMGLIAALVTFEKAGPWGRGARLAGAAVLAVLAAAVLAVPHELPGFVVPGATGMMD